MGAGRNIVIVAVIKAVVREIKDQVDYVRDAVHKELYFQYSDIRDRIIKR